MNLTVQTQPAPGILTPQQREEILTRFVENQDVKENSQDLYKRTLRGFFNWVDKKSYLLSDLTRVEVMQYREELLQSGKSSLTVGSYITSVRRFYEWAEANRLSPNIAKGIRTPKRKQQFKKQALTLDQASELLKHCQGDNVRDFAVINLLLRAGLRTIEIIRANVGDIAFKGSQRVLYVHGKGRDEKDNFVLLTDKAFKPIEAYLSTRAEKSPSEPLFLSGSNNNKGGRLTTRSISRIAKNGLKAIGLNDKSFTAHSLRHTTAVNILRAGGSREQAQHTLRHASSTTTQIYTETIKEEQRLKNSGEALLDGLF